MYSWATDGPAGTCASAETESSLSLGDSLCGSSAVCRVSSFRGSVSITGSGGGAVRGALCCVAGGVGCFLGRPGRRGDVLLVRLVRAGVCDWVGAMCPVVSLLVAVVVSFVVVVVSVSLPVGAVLVWTVAVVLLSGV